MLDLLFWLLVFVVSMFILVKASDYFIESAKAIKDFFNISSFIIGVTLVSIGTSLPELVSSLIATIEKSSEIVAGNVVGSNIANILLVLSMAAIFGKKLKLEYKMVHIDLSFLLTATFFAYISLMDGIFTLAEGLFCLFFAIIYIAYLREAQIIYSSDIKDGKEKKEKPWKLFFIFISSAVLLYIGAKYVVESVIMLSNLLSIGKDIIAVTAVAFGTSLPEVAVSVNAARKKLYEIAIGNVMGSNIFNILLVLGISSLVSSLIITQNIITLALPMMLVSTLLFLFIIWDKSMTRWEGLMMFILYLFFILRISGII